MFWDPNHEEVDSESYVSYSDTVRVDLRYNRPRGHPLNSTGLGPLTPALDMISDFKVVFKIGTKIG